MQRKDFLELFKLTPITAQTMKLQALSTIAFSIAASDKIPGLFYITW